MQLFFNQVNVQVTFMNLTFFFISDMFADNLGCRMQLRDAEHPVVLRQFSCGMQNIEGDLRQYLCKLSPNIEKI